LPEFQLSPPDEPPQNNVAENPVATAFSAPPVTLDQSPDVPFDNRETITSAQLPDKVCTQCLEDNLIRSGVIETFVKCQKCGEEFCQHGVSKLDPQYCVHCCNDFKIVDVIEQEQRPIYNKDGGLIAVRQFKVRHITLSGLHWLFFNRAISSLSDIELEHAIEYHQSIYHGMIYEREARRVQKSQRNRGKHAANEASPLDGSVQSPFVVNQDGVQFTTVAQQARKKVRTRTVKVSQSSTASASKAAQSPEAIAGLIKTLLAAGFTQEQILAMGKK
jgi:hypothetical protein